MYPGKQFVTYFSYNWHTAS